MPVKLPAWMTKTRGRKILSVTGLVVLSLAFAGWFVVRPIVVTHIVRNLLRDTLQTNVEISSASYAFGSTATIKGLRVYHPTSGELLAEVDEIEAFFEKSPLSTPTRITSVAIEGVRLHAVREEDGRWNFEAVKPKKSEGEPTHIGQVTVKDISADVKRRGSGEGFVADLDLVTVKPTAPATAAARNLRVKGDARFADVRGIDVEFEASALQDPDRIRKIALDGVRAGGPWGRGDVFERGPDPSLTAAIETAEFEPNRRARASNVRIGGLVPAEIDSATISLGDAMSVEIDGLRATAEADETGVWNFQKLPSSPGGGSKISNVILKNVRAQIRRAGVAEHLEAEFDGASAATGGLTAAKGTATVTGLRLKWSEGSKTDSIASVPATTVTFTGEIAAPDAIEEILIERPEFWAGINADGKPELQARLKKILGTSPESSKKPKFDRVLVKRLRIRQGTIHGTLATPEGDRWEIPIEAVESQIDWVSPPEVRVETLTAKLCGGNFYGNESVLRLDETGESFVNATIEEIDMTKLAGTTRFSKCRVSGTLSAAVQATIKPNGEIFGAGRAWALQARMWDLPVFKSIVSELGLKLPQESKFDRIDAKFALSGDRFIFKDLATKGGDAVDVTGEGQMKFNGTDITIHLTPRLIDASNVPLVGTQTQAVTDLIGGTAITIVATGKITEPTIEVVHGKTVTDPIKKFIDIFK